MKAGAGWHDVCILNISSRGMLMQAGVPPVRGSYLEIRCGMVLVIARVMWTKNHRFGVRSQDRLSIDSIVGDFTPSSPASEPSAQDRRFATRTQLPADERSRLQGRMMEYGFAAALGVAAAVFVGGQVYSILSRPADAVGLALSGD